MNQNTASRKRSAKDDGPRASRKRVQNRISQQCLRQRQQAHIRQLESVVELLNSTSGTTDGAESRNEAIISAHLKLIEQNRQLQEAVFRMRKKLLSLSNMGSVAANDEIFDQLLQTPAKKESRSQSESSPPTESDPTTVLDTAPQLPENELDQLDVSPILGESYGMSASSADSLTITQEATAPKLSDGSQDKRSSGQDATVFGLEMMTPCMTDFELHQGLAPPSCPLPASTETNKSYSHVTHSYTDLVLKACKSYMADTSDAAKPTSIQRPPAAKEDCGSLTAERMVRKLSQAVVHLLASWAGLEAYLYGIGAFMPMELIVRWRLTHHLSDWVAIPEPFSPTMLQYTCQDYPMVIDFLNWPSLRDQLIIHANTYDTDTIIHDVVLNTVIELPGRQVSVNIYDLYYNKLVPCSNMLSNSYYMHQSPTAHKFQRDLSDSLKENPHAAQEVIMKELSQRIQFGLHDEGNDAGWTAAFLDGPNYSPEDLLTSPWYCRPRRNRLASHFGADQFVKWKLSPQFAAKYPFLECSNLVSAYEMVPCNGLSLL